MSVFTDRLHNSGKMIWDKLLSHPFPEMTYTNRISDEAFAQWVRQDYIFVREAIPFIAQLISKAPLELRSNLADIIGMPVRELDKLAEGLPENRLAAMEEQYLTTGRYEYMFWTMAQTSEAWPV